MDELQIKKDKLENIINELDSVVVAFSGGVDSALLLAVAAKNHNIKTIGITVKSISYAGHELKDAEDIVHILGVEHAYLEVDQLGIPEFAGNGPERCYYCKKAIFEELKKFAKQNGYAYVVDGSNIDDIGDYRPGARALEELGIRSPLKEAGLDKKEIRKLSQEMGLFTADKPSYACLASRIPYGEEISEEKLRRIEKAENYLRGLGFTNVRVRSHGSLARIEVAPEQINLFNMGEKRQMISKKMKEYGFIYVAIDLDGFRQGSMNAEIKK